MPEDYSVVEIRKPASWRMCKLEKGKIRHFVESPF
jgi:hypothetical protein